MTTAVSTQSLRKEFTLGWGRGRVCLEGRQRLTANAWHDLMLPDVGAI